MNIEVSVKKLIGVVEKAARATGKNLSLPILACIVLKVEDGGNLNIKSTNLDIGCNFDLQVKVKSSGSIAVPASILLNFLSSIKSDSNINLSSKEGNLSVTHKNNTSVIKGLPLDDFPEIPSVQEGKKCILKSNDFVNGLRHVWYSASTSSIKPELAAVYIYPGGQELVFVATDSFRLAEKKVHYKNPTDFQSVLIPFKNVPDIIKILEGFDGELEIHFDKNQMEITFLGGKLISRVIDGSFPDYKQIIPKSVNTEGIILKSDLVAVLRSAQVFSDNFNQVRFKFNGKTGKLTVSSKNNDVGEYNEDVEAKVSGDDLEISFNYKYIIDALQSIESDSLHLSLAGLGKPMIVSGVSDKSFMYIVMPMNK